VPAESFNVGAARTEQPDPMFGTPGDVLTHIQRVRLPGQSRVTAQEADQSVFLFGAEQRSTNRERGGSGVGLHVGTSSLG